MMIKVPSYMRHYVPGSLLARASLTLVFETVGDATAEVQREMWRELEAQPTSQQLVFLGDVGSTDNRSPARYAAAYLAHLVNQRSGISPLWVHCSKRPVVDELTHQFWVPDSKADSACCTVIDFGTDLHDLQVDRARDVVASRPGPHFIVCSSVSPIEIARKMFKQCRCLFHLTQKRSSEL